jgi:hypothetical protein
VAGPAGQPVTRLVVIPCSAAKLDHRAPAGQLYTGSWHRLARQAADALAARTDATVMILSAAHALVRLDQELDPYDTSLGSLMKPEWSTGRPVGTLQLGHRVGDQLFDMGCTSLVGLLPRSYWEIVSAGRIGAELEAWRRAGKPWTDHHLIEHSWPLEGCTGVGYQRQRLVEIRDNLDGETGPFTVAS